MKLPKPNWIAILLLAALAAECLPPWPATSPATAPDGVLAPLRVSFCLTETPASHVCYVLDASGSMIDNFDLVRQEVLTSIGRLKAPQDFHVLVMAGGNPKEMPFRRLVVPNDANKKEAGRFLEDIRAAGRTDPVPALRRAFDVLAKADPLKPGKVIYLLTDGVFPDERKLLDLIAERNADKGVIINTILFQNRPPQAEKVMKQIASGSGGQYVFAAVNGKEEMIFHDRTGPATRPAPTQPALPAVR